MTYTEITKRIILQVMEADKRISEIESANITLHYSQLGGSEKERIIGTIRKVFQNWLENSINLLIDSGFVIEAMKFKNFQPIPYLFERWNPELSQIHNNLGQRSDLLLSFAENIEYRKQNKEIISLKIDDFDNFASVRNISFKDVENFSQNKFLEEDIEEAFLGCLGERYKEPDSGSEIRDLYSDKIKLKGKRLSAVFMFKGRGLKMPLTIGNSGDKGNQLLKLARNTSAECFIVQHINKIEQDAREALIDHLLIKNKHSKVYVCFIDGTDTARFLKSLGKDLTALAEHKI